MKRIFQIVTLGSLLAMSCFLRAEEVEIQLMEVIQMGSLQPEDDPFDSSSEAGSIPTRPRSFRATINGNALSITKQEENIPYAQATVVNASNGSIVLNQQFTSSLYECISNAGVYVLHIQTPGGALVGQFIVQ